MQVLLFANKLYYSILKMDYLQLKTIDNSSESQAKWIIANGIQSLLDDNLEAIKTCKQREKSYLLGQKEAYQNSLDVMKKYIISTFDLRTLTS